MIENVVVSKQERIETLIVQMVVEMLICMETEPGRALSVGNKENKEIKRVVRWTVLVEATIIQSNASQGWGQEENEWGSGAHSVPDGSPPATNLARSNETTTASTE